MRTQEIYERQEDGTVILIETIEVEDTSIEEQIKDKEQQLLDMYNELQALKEQNG
jgi:hypothetical protein